jgi:aminoglycoside phosphotransferase family enzyme
MEPYALIDALSHPDAYPDHPSQVSMRQTHISWLFFTERYVYKVKKPVDFGFLDFTSMELRKLFCDEEVRLNRRLAPEVYLGVVEVKVHEGRIRLGGSGKTIDYAVQMCRLPEERMLPTLLAEGRVSVDTMRRLARQVAEFHARAETGGAIDEAGTVATVLTNWLENFDQTRPYLGFPLPQETYDQIQNRVLAFCRVGEELFGQRIAEGRIRDGHGDLRAEHICVTEPIAIFDCIEFNCRFRRGDVAADVAFLAMDLDERGYPALSHAFVEAYIDYSGDHGLRRMLTFYQCYRAFVRAKVECFRLDDPMISAGEKRAALRAAYRYGQLAAGWGQCWSQTLDACRSPRTDARTGSAQFQEPDRSITPC